MVVITTTCPQPFWVRASLRLVGSPLAPHSDLFLFSLCDVLMWSDLDALVDQDDDEDAAPALCSDSDSDLGDELQVQDVRTVRTVVVADLVELIAPGLAVVAQPKITFGKPSQRAKDDLDALVD